MSTQEVGGAALTRADWRSRIRSLAPRARSEALRECEAALALHPDASELHALLGDLLDLLGRREEADASLSAAIALDPVDGKNLLRVAEVYVRQGRREEPLELVRRARQTGLFNLVRRGVAGRLLLALEEFQDAERELADSGEATDEELRLVRLGLEDEAAQGVQGQHRALYRKGLDLLRRGRPQAAAAEFAALTQACPKAAAAWLGWRGALSASGLRGEAAAVERRWRSAAPALKPIIPSIIRRRFSPRGLLFDPHERLPVRAKEDLLHRVGSPEALKRRDDALLVIDPGGAPIELDPIISLKASGEDRRVMRLRSVERSVAGVTGAALVGRGVVLNRDGSTFKDLIALSPRKLKAVLTADGLAFEPGVLRDGFCGVKVFDEPAFLLAGPTDASFGDWMVNFLPRLALAEASQLDCRFVVGAHCSTWALDTLAVLGVSRDRIIFHDASGVSLFPKLYAPSWPLPVRHRPMADLFGVYHRARRRGSGPRERLYLSRAHVSQRRMANEAEVSRLFERRGFRVIEPGRMELEEVLSAFARPAVVAGAYGSAFLNVAFASERPVGLALMPPEPESYLDELTLWLGSLGSRFGCVRGAPAQEDQWYAPLDEVDAGIDRVLEYADGEPDETGPRQLD